MLGNPCIYWRFLTKSTKPRENSRVIALVTRYTGNVCFATPVLFGEGAPRGAYDPFGGEVAVC